MVRDVLACKTIFLLITVVLITCQKCQQICLFPSCHLVTVPPGPALADALRSSPVIRGEDGYAPAAGFGSGFDDVDPNLDPELALVSLFCM